MKAREIELDHLPDKCLFISDIHLERESGSEQDVACEQDAILLLQQAGLRGYTIFLLGDIFDYWMEIKCRIPPIAPSFLASLQKLAAEHTIYMVTGNHDNWTDGFFIQMGVKECQDLISTKNGSILAHGDGFRDEKWGLRRPKKHRLLRNKWFIKLFQTLFSPQKCWHLMQDFSKDSYLKSLGKASEEAILDTWVEKQMQEHHRPLIICGHDHVARMKEFDGGAYINSGFFYKDRTFVIRNGTRLALCRFEQTEWIPLQQTSISFEP